MLNGLIRQWKILLMKYHLRTRVSGWVSTTDNHVIDEVKTELENDNFRVSDFFINKDEYNNYLQEANYPEFEDYYSHYQSRNTFKEKSLEHFLSAKFLELSNDDVYLDIANCYSPVPEIYSELYGCKTYRQDLIFPQGINGNMIGGNAGNLPVEDGFATKMALHCSFEHFEGDADIRFIKEASRVLRSGGRLCIVPLYLFTKYAIQTDVAAWPAKGLEFDPYATIYIAEGWGERHGRFYDVYNLRKRIMSNLNNMELTIYVIRNQDVIDPSCYVKFAAVFEKK